MTKIAIFCDDPKNTIGGILTYCQSLKLLMEQNKDFSLKVFPLKPCRVIFGFPIYDSVTIKSALLSDDFDIIHINGFISPIPCRILAVMKKLRMQKPVVYTPHAHPFYTLNHPIRNRLFFHLLVKSALRKSDSVISINHEDCTFLSIYNKNVVTIPHWSCKVLDSSPKSLPKEQPKKTMLLFVGRNDANKNLAQLYSLPAEKYEVVCVTNIKPQRDDFVFKSHISDDELQSLYAHASLAVVPSRYEAFSYAALESMLSGTPVLISDRVRIADFLQGVSGITVYEFGNADDFLGKVDGAIEKTVDVEKVRDIFSAERAFYAYKKLYDSIKKNATGISQHL